MAEVVIDMAGGQTGAVVEEKETPRPAWWRTGDMGSLLTLLSDNLALLLALTAGLLGPVGVPPATVFGKVLPGLGLSTLLGNVFFAFQARRLSLATDRGETTAQPYGIDPSVSFIYLYSLMLRVAEEEVSHGATREEGGEEAYRVAALVNFLSGLLQVAAALPGRRFLELMGHIPPPLVLAPMSGVMLTLLVANHLRDVLAEGVRGLAPLCIVLWGYFGGCFKVGKHSANPAAWVAVAVATVLAWGTRHYDVKDNLFGAAHVVLEERWKVAVPFPLADISAKTWGHVFRSASLVLLVSFTNFLCTLRLCKAPWAIGGDDYNPRDSIIADGMCTAVGAMVGSTFATSFFWHPAFKERGGGVGYSVAHGVVFFVACFSGLLALVVAVVPRVATSCLVVVVGIASCSTTIKETPKHQYPTIAVGIFPHVAGWGLRLIASARVGCARPVYAALSTKYPALYSLG
eukprot:Sspe_Gene.74446::Locus_46201_Transcript_1_1_Confidence_1.000_Length_1432::g.74446::m.74446/K06901/pbuG; putative MFS transporter, AGZA family, xanthine/uracil permease